MQTSSYSLVTPTGSITFTPSDIDQARSTATIVVYVKEQGNETNVLTLTRPGTDGVLTYRYVGGAFWERAVNNTTSVDASLDAFVYGVPTAGDDVPVSGQANFAVDLLGAIAATENVSSLAGRGTITVDFGSSSLILVGTMDLISEGSVVESGILFAGDAKLASTGKFSGSFKFDQFGLFEGDLAGMLFGPAAEEIGATFSAKSSDGRLAAGAIIGRRGAADTPVTQFEDGGVLFSTFPQSQSFEASSNSLAFTFNGAPGQSQTTGNFSNISLNGGGNALFRYDRATNTYTIQSSDSVRVYDLATNSFRFLGPQDEASTGFFGIDNGEFRLSLSYTKQGTLAFRSGDDYLYESFIYGIGTDPADVPTTGAAVYDLDVGGVVAATAYRNPMLFNGRGTMTVDFAAGSLTGYSPLEYEEYAFISGLFGETAIGDWRFEGNLAADPSNFAGTVTMTGIGDYSGEGRGQFFGPGAVELGGTFEAADGSGNSAIGHFAGVFNPDKVPTPTGTLAALTLPTALAEVSSEKYQAFDQHYDGDIVGIVYDPADGSYAISFRDENLVGSPTREMVLDAASANSSYDSASHDGFSGTILDGTGGSTNEWFGWRVKPTGGEITLSYMSFGNIVVVRNNVADDYHPYATGLVSASIPRTGGGTYSGLTTGTARVIDNSTFALQSYRIDGTVNFAVDFAGQTLTGTFSDMNGQRYYASDASAGSTTRIFGGFTVSGTIGGLSGSAPEFSGEEVTTNWVYAFEGLFFGPDGVELGGTFAADNISAADPQAEQIRIDGSFGARKD